MKYISLFIFCSIVISCHSQISRDSVEAQLDQLFSKEFSTEEPGGSILIKKGEEIAFLKSYGLADLATKEKITENTVFNTGSISKTFVSNGILILAEQDSLSLDDPITQYFDDFDHLALAE